MSRYYDPEGKPMGMWEWAARFEQERHVGSTYIPGVAWVSTVWLGLDHNFGGGPPLIFESMAFEWQGKWNRWPKMKEIPKLPDSFFHEELDCERYSTLEEAILGHERMVRKFMLPQIPQLISGLYLTANSETE